jgi:hypothetical protein
MVMVCTVPCSVSWGDQRLEETLGSQHKEMDDRRNANEVGNKRQRLVSATGREIVGPGFSLGPVGVAGGLRG